MEPGTTFKLRNMAAFVIVGAFATMTYLISTLGVVRLGAPPAIANLAGISGSLFVSYIGHHRVTFLRCGQHRRFLTRFMMSSAILGALSTATTWIVTNRLGMSAAGAALAIAVGYPPISYLVNSLWTFREGG